MDKEKIIEYNKTLERFENGVKYLQENPDKMEKLMPEVLKIMDKLDSMIDEFEMSDENILNGFEGG